MTRQAHDTPGSQGTPDAPQRGRVAERVAVHEREMRGTADREPAGMRVAQHITAAPGRRAERFPGLKPGAHQAFHFPGKVAGPDGPAAEVAPGRDGKAGRMRRPDTLLGYLKPLGGALPAGRRGEPVDRGGGTEAQHR